MALSTCDPCSFSRPDLCIVTNIDLDLAVDFEKNVIAGTAHLHVEKKRDAIEALVLDTKDLNIEAVSEQGSGRVLEFKHHDEGNIKAFGSKLEITLPSDAGKRLIVSIQYITSPTCSALQWLCPEQTAGKRQPYLFSQCQAIHARSLFPCQDTPTVKFTYTAKVKAPREITILMSAVRLGAVACEGDSSSRVHQFEQKVPIPSYLLAIVGGDIESRDIGPRSKVWSEKELVEQAAFEFAETEKMLRTAENLLGPYVWGQYDLLILPPSFPYGGMENPCLTFVTPTILAGDRSLADVVAHEISHSWTGNLVTNSTFQDFWLNEGHTVFAERKITSRMHGGEPLRQFLANEGWKTLQETVATLTKAKESAYTKLIPDLTGVDPDDAFSSVPYEKGFALLCYLEQILGGSAAWVLDNASVKRTEDGSTVLKQKHKPTTSYAGFVDVERGNITVWKVTVNSERVPPSSNSTAYDYEPIGHGDLGNDGIVGDMPGSDDPSVVTSTHAEPLAVYEPFLRAYIEHFKYQSITSQQWKDFLFSYFCSEEDQRKLQAVDWNTWFFAEGMPNVQPQFDSSLAKPCQDLASQWLTAADTDLSSFTATDLQQFSALQKREFIALLLQAETVVTVAKLQTMDTLYQLSAIRNSEICFRWLRLGVKSRWKDIIPRALEFVTEQGRMKFVRPIYRDLYQWEEAREAAIENFKKHRVEMHSTTAKEVAKDLHLAAH